MRVVALRFRVSITSGLVTTADAVIPFNELVIERLFTSNAI